MEADLREVVSSLGMKIAQLEVDLACQISINNSLKNLINSEKEKSEINEK